ncbi:histidine kinase [Nibribacter ruber]|uniref:Histidine kinase n=1 Tax=Nibribacter ruber TaxID=2698458 RepID=A0A6P1P2F2_9BACT|nr:histidine kinase [Nibribacter ruber]QHL88589.1 histidine kinase [Nibribacter ruber]
MNQAQIDFQQLRIKHILFKSKVRSVLYGGTIDEAFFSSAGPISVWFSTVGLKYQREAEMFEAKQVYQNLESTARSLFSLYNNGKMEQAQNGLNEIESLSEKFVAVLSKLEAKLIR